ncbi:hypothetical protein [Mesoterricola silvestris]|uniref:Uncharacterized protein n=1 Tax=Mesoterricola silvestris TaxID=2927979 RepID=A0AA48GQ42_9BACT|nr:hypothetical protein [Mesoterricola silvestris]BDU73645.1 hypothetical protein METEAL_28190 [Mesoterricola silvestris]
MTGPAGPGGPLPQQFEDGLRLLAAALALKGDRRSEAAAISAACSAIQRFLKILEAASLRRLPDPGGNVQRLRDQCGALLNLRQEPADALDHTLEAARLARDEAARVIALLAVTHD